MAEPLQFDLVSPERLVLSQQVDGVVVPGEAGDFTVLARHAPLMSTLRPGVIEVLGSGVDHARIFVGGGFAEVTPAGLTVLAEDAVPMTELDVAGLDQRIRNLEEDVADAQDDEARMRASDELSHLRQIRASL